MQMLAAAGVSAEHRAGLAGMLGMQPQVVAAMGPTAGGIPGAAAAAEVSKQMTPVELNQVFIYMQQFHPQLSVLLQQKAQQVMIAKHHHQQQRMLQLQRGNSSVYTHGVAGAAAAAAGAAAAGAGAAIGWGRRRAAKKKRDADFYGDSDEEYNADEPKMDELHRCDINQGSCLAHAMLMYVGVGVGV
jgi:hypothetical protein